MGEARAAARRTRSPTRIQKGDPRAGLLGAGFFPNPKTLFLRAERPEGEARRRIISQPHEIARFAHLPGIANASIDYTVLEISNH